MRSDPDWTSAAQEPLPELINHLLQGTDVEVCVHACVSVGVFSFEFHVRLQHSFFKAISKQDSSFAQDIWECFAFGGFFFLNMKNRWKKNKYWSKN